MGRESKTNDNSWHANAKERKDYAVAPATGAPMFAEDNSSRDQHKST